MSLALPMAGKERRTEIPEAMEVDDREGDESMVEQTSSDHWNKMYVGPMKKACKRQRLEYEDEEFLIPSYLLHAEQVKVRSLESKLEGLQQNFMRMSKERDSHVQETMKLKFKASQQKMSFDEILDGLLNKLTESERSRSELESKVEAMKKVETDQQCEDDVFDSSSESEENQVPSMNPKGGEGSASETRTPQQELPPRKKQQVPLFVSCPFCRSRIQMRNFRTHVLSRHPGQPVPKCPRGESVALDYESSEEVFMTTTTTKKTSRSSRSQSTR